MNKLILFLVSGILAFGAVACQDNTNKTSEAPGTTSETAAPAKEASQKTAITGSADKTGTTVKKGTTENAGGGVKTIVKNKLEEKFPGSKLEVEEKAGVLTIKGTVPSQAELKKIEPAVKEYKLQGVKSVKVEAKVASTKPQ
jgi:hyperosmotically inducible periplasmic protein